VPTYTIKAQRHENVLTEIKVNFSLAFGDYRKREITVLTKSIFRRIFGAARKPKIKYKLPISATSN